MGTEKSVNQFNARRDAGDETNTCHLPQALNEKVAAVTNAAVTDAAVTGAAVTGAAVTGAAA